MKIKRIVAGMLILMFMLIGCSKKEMATEKTGRHTDILPKSENTKETQEDRETKKPEENPSETSTEQETSDISSDTNNIKLIQLSADANAYQIQINDCVLTFPMEYSELEEKGWIINNLYGSSFSPILSGQCTVAQFMNGSTQLGFVIYNPDITVRKVADCVIAGIEIDASDYTDDDFIALPGGIVIGSTGMEKVLEILGDPDESDVYEGENAKVDEMIWKDKKAWYFSLEEASKRKMTFKNGVLIDLKMACFEPTEGFVYSEGNKELAPDYEIPQVLTDDITDNIVRFAGDLYQLPFPVYALLENGWEMTTNTFYDKASEAQGVEAAVAGNEKIMDLDFERNGVRISLTVKNIYDEAIILKNALVVAVGSVREWADDFGEGGISEVSGGIALGMTEEAFVSLLEAEEIEYTSENVIIANQIAAKYSFTTLENPYCDSAVLCQNGNVISIQWNVEED